MSAWNKVKKFIIGGAIASLGIGGVTAVSAVKDKQKAETWEKKHPDADSIYVNTDDGQFYAEKKADTSTLKKLRIEEMKLEKQKQNLIISANEMLAQAIKNKDFKGVERAINKGANVSGKHLLQMVKDPSEEAYQIARYFIKIDVDTHFADKNGATARDYAATMNNIRGETLKREIDEKQKYYHESFKPIVTPEMMEIDKKLEIISQNIENAYGYKEQLDTNKDLPYFQYEKNDGKRIIETGSGEDCRGVFASFVSNARQKDKI